MSYNVCLPNYSIGADCYKEIPYFARYYGKKAVVIGGKTAMSKAKDALLEGIAGSDLKILDFIWYGGDSTYENGNALIANETVQQADIIFGVGGGRACDTCKYVANEMDKPLFTFPTVGSNCASVTAICVIYNPDGSFREYYYPKVAEHTFINSAIIADSPYELLWAGIGDALSKEFEAVFGYAGGEAIVYFPTFTYEVDMDLVGVTAERCPGAFRELTGLVENGAPSIGSIYQKAKIEVTKEGTKAAVTTGILATFSAQLNSQPAVIKFDHPFVFVIRDNETGEDLFTGLVNDPA